MGKCKQCKGRLEEDFISDYLTMSVDQRPCALCRGTGVIRTGPYRLADGTWSDGVDRTRRLSSSEFGEENPQRLGIFRPSFIDEEWIARGDVWVIVRGLKSVEWFATHAEAIAYADRMARTNQGENND